jgi:hypothetical protein
MDGELHISVAGVQRAYDRVDTTSGIDFGSCSVSDVLNETPNTASFVARGFTPQVGQEVIIGLGSTDAADRIFAGYILTIEQVYVGTPAALAHQCSCIDYTWGLNRRKVIGYYTGTATEIVDDLVTDYAVAYGYTATAVEAAMPTLDGGITFTNEDLTTCLSRVMARVGGYWYCDYAQDVHAFLTETGSEPEDLTSSHPSLRDFYVEYDISQVVTRCLSEGGGGTTLSDCAAGETILPVSEPEWYTYAGGFSVFVDVGPQRVTFTGVDTGGGGGLVGPGINPSSAPALAGADSATGVENGAHDYAVTFVTAAHTPRVSERRVEGRRAVR